MFPVAHIEFATNFISTRTLARTATCHDSVELAPEHRARPPLIATSTIVTKQKIPATPEEAAFVDPREEISTPEEVSLEALRESNSTPEEAAFVDPREENSPFEEVSLEAHHKRILYLLSQRLSQLGARISAHEFRHVEVHPSVRAGFAPPSRRIERGLEVSFNGEGEAEAEAARE